MNLQIDVSTNKVISKMMGALSNEGRKDLNGAGAEALAHFVQTHIRRYVFQKHLTAHRLGAAPTGHYEKGANDIHTEVTPDAASVVIPIPGIRRAFGDVHITAQRAGALTIPMDALAYGRRVSEVKALGWKIFRVKTKNKATLLMGTDGEVTKPLYILKKAVTQRRDPSLLPTEDEMRRTVGKAMLARIKQIVEKAKQEKTA